MEKQIAPSRAVISLKNQEQKIVNYLSDKSEVAWEELAQFAKDPQNVKKSSLQKAVSEIKRKYQDQNLPLPFNCNFISLAKEQQKQNISTPLVQIRTTIGGNRVPVSNTEPDAYIDFKLDRYFKRVITRNGRINLSDSQWELFGVLYQNIGKRVSLEDMKAVVYKNFGSKTPHNWADALRRTLTQLRTNLPELKVNNRLVTMVGGNTTFYMLS